MTTDQPNQDPTTRDRREVATAARLVAIELQRWAETGQTADGQTGTFAEVGYALARRLDRAGLITRSE